MTADPTPAADPRLAELTEAVRLVRTYIAIPLSDERFAAALLANMPARTATTEAEALAALVRDWWSKAQRNDAGEHEAYSRLAAALAATGGEAE